ncbi:DgyrCDS1232 [Dimorphilus gyrociliatus]|uniref:WD repeat domain-containing protein 83 n=1 Tax=Dimorphilus gyrociliatus TaxID=2664684 RepID=A0A7I8V6Y5_9ANNE|nr:DgyrCDS1232 [Dimorphilus gyrociliatus]
MAKPIAEKLLNTIDCKQNAVRAVRYNTDGQYCMTCGSNNQLKLWNPKRGSLLATYSGHGQEVMDAAAACDNAQLVSCGLDKNVILWDVADARVVRKFRGHAGCVNCVRFNEEATIVISASLDGSVRIWDCKSNRVIQVLDEAKDSVTSLWINNHEILTGSVDGRLRKYDIRQGQLFEDYLGRPINCVSMTRDEQCLLASSLDSTVRLFDKQTGELLNSYESHKNTQFKIDCCLNNFDTHIICGSEDGCVYTWDLVKATVTVKLLHKGVGVVSSLSPHPSEPMLLTAAEKKVFLWGPKDDDEQTT